MLSPKEIPGYRIVGLVGAGGMSTVYEALDLKLNRSVALKILHPYLLSDRVAVERFRREALAAAKLEHPNIVRIHDYLSTSEFNIIVMEFVPGSDLHSMVKNKGPLPPAAAFYVMRQIASALQGAHAANIVHRDIKPSNILLHKDRRILLTDFGLARNEFDPKLTMGDAIAGTPQFMAPEQIAGGDVSAASDIFSWAVTCHFALFGSLPYATEDFVPLVNDIRSGNLKFSENFHQLLPPMLQALLSRCLLPNPKERPRNGSVLIRMLDETNLNSDSGRLEFLALVDGAGDRTAASSDAAKTVVLAKSGARKKGLTAVVAIALVIAAVFGLRSSRESIEPQTPILYELPQKPELPADSPENPKKRPAPALPATTARLFPKPRIQKELSPADSGHLFVFSEPWAEYVIDGRIRGTAPMAANEMIALTEGKHVLTLYRESFSELTDTIEILKGKILRKRYSLQRAKE